MRKISITTRPIENGITGFEESIQSAIKLHEGKRVKITIEEFKSPRSNKQNRYWWGVCIPILRDIFIDFREPGDDTDYNNPENVHYMAKLHIWHLYKSVPFMSGQTLIVLPSPKVNTKEWNDLMIKTQQWAAERGYQIPDPQVEVPEWILTNSGYKT